ncbi:MAG: hypothetical protein QOF48_1127, partial [Verrucomicrobiota bacterium]
MNARLHGLWIVALGLPAIASAQFADTILSGSAITNYTGYVIDADQAAVTNNVSFNRESLLFNAVARTTNSSGTTLTRTNVFVFRLLDTNNAAFPIFDVGGNTNAAATYNVTNAFTVPGFAATTVTMLGNVRPAVRLNPYNRYTVEFRVLTNGIFAGTSTNDGPRQYYHFTNTISADASFNVISSLTNLATNQLYAVQTAPGRDAFKYDARYELRRYDDFAVTNTAPTNVPVTISYELRDAVSGVVVPLVNASTNFVVSVPPHTSGTNPPQPAVTNGSVTLLVKPVSQIDSVNNTYRLMAWISHTNKTSAPPELLAGNTNSTTG